MTMGLNELLNGLRKKYKPTYFLLLSLICFLASAGIFLALYGVDDFGKSVGLAAILLAIIMLGTKNSRWNLDNHTIEE